MSDDRRLMRGNYFGRRVIHKPGDTPEGKPRHGGEAPKLDAVVAVAPAPITPKVTKANTAQLPKPTKQVATKKDTIVAQPLPQAVVPPPSPKVSDDAWETSETLSVESPPMVEEPPKPDPNPAIAPKKHPVIVDKVFYDTATLASRAIGIPVADVIARCNDKDNHPWWRWIV